MGFRRWVGLGWKDKLERGKRALGGDEYSPGPDLGVVTQVYICI